MKTNIFIHAQKKNTCTDDVSPGHGQWCPLPNQSGCPCKKKKSVREVIKVN